MQVLPAVVLQAMLDGVLRCGGCALCWAASGNWFAGGSNGVFWVLGRMGGEEEDPCLSLESA